MTAHSPNGPTDLQVMVVGAGPTGLLLAAELERRGVRCLLIDEEDHARGSDRATVIHPRSLEIFEAVGLVDRFLGDGVRVRGARFRSDGEALGELHLGTETSSYGFDIGISEEVTESVLTAYLEEQGGSVTRSTRLVGLRPWPDGVTAELDQRGHRSEVSVAWTVGCDGFRSSVRDGAGIDFPGTAVESPWAVFDAATDGSHEGYDLTFAHLDVPTVILTPLPGRRWRVYVRPESDESDLVADATEVVRRYDPDVTFTDIENPVRFRCHSRVASRFKAGHVLLAGDAAHVCSPTEGHGMNTGLQDAFNLAWKLALVCRGLRARRVFWRATRPSAVRLPCGSRNRGRIRRPVRLCAPARTAGPRMRGSGRPSPIPGRHTRRLSHTPSWIVLMPAATSSWVMPTTFFLPVCGFRTRRPSIYSGEARAAPPPTHPPGEPHLARPRGTRSRCRRSPRGQERARRIDRRLCHGRCRARFLRASRRRRCRPDGSLGRGATGDRTVDRVGDPSRSLRGTASGRR